METTGNKECDNYMKQMFKTCENAYKTFCHIIFVEIWKLKLYQMVYMWRKIIVLKIFQPNFVTAGTRKSWVINCDYAISLFEKMLGNCLN